MISQMYCFEKEESMVATKSNFYVLLFWEKLIFSAHLLTEIDENVMMCQ